MPNFSLISNERTGKLEGMKGKMRRKGEEKGGEGRGRRVKVREKKEFQFIGLLFSHLPTSQQWLSFCFPPVTLNFGLDLDLRTW